MIRYGTVKTKSAYLAALFAIVTWSVTFTNIRALLAEFSSLEILVVRFAMAWAVLWTWGLTFGGLSGTRPSRKDELLFAGMGFTGISGYQFLENCAIFYTSASNIAIFVSFAPIATAVVTWLFVRDKSMSVLFLLGSLVAVCGAALVSLAGVTTLKFSPIGDLMAMGAMLSWGFYSLLMELTNRRGVSPVVAIRKSMFWALVMLVPVAVWGTTEGGLRALGGSFGVNLELQANISRFSSLLNWVNLVFLGVFASAACFVLWNMACKVLGTVRTSIGLYLTPVIGVLVAMLFLGERVSWMEVCGGVLILAGVAVANHGLSARNLKGKETVNGNRKSTQCKAVCGKSACAV